MLEAMEDEFPPSWFPNNYEVVKVPECRWCEEDAWFIVHDVPTCARGKCLQATKNYTEIQ